MSKIPGKGFLYIICPFFIYMNVYFDNHNFKKIRCGSTIKDGRPCPKYIGMLQTDVPHASIFYCKDCKVNHRYIVHETGMVERESVHKDEIIMRHKKKIKTTLNEMAILT